MTGMRSRGDTGRRSNVGTAASSTDTSEDTQAQSTRDAFKPGSGKFGWMVSPAAKVKRRVLYDDETGQWVLPLGGPGNPVLRTDTKDAMEQFLDYLENRRTDGTH